MGYQGILGIVALLGFAWALSEDRWTVRWRLVVGGLILQLVAALLLLKVEPLERALATLNKMVLAVQSATLEGTTFVFGYIGGGNTPFDVTTPAHTFVLAFQGLPLILVVSAISALLFYWRILPLIVRAFAYVLQKSLGLDGATGVAAAANVFVGMIEAPLLIRPYLREMSRSGLFVVMTVGMATIAGNMFVLYASILVTAIPDGAGHLLTASLISAPAAVAVAALMVPGTDNEPQAEAAVFLDEQKSAVSAIVNGTFEGVKLVVAVAALLIVAIALVSLTNQLLALLPEVGGSELSLQRVLGWILMPVAWLLGLPWEDAALGGELLGTKVILNELVAYLDLAAQPAGELSLSSRLIMTYALCGFANLGSLGILLGGLTAMVPERQSEIIALGPRSLVAGNLASFMTGAVVGLIL